MSGHSSARIIVGGAADAGSALTDCLELLDQEQFSLDQHYLEMLTQREGC